MLKIMLFHEEFELRLAASSKCRYTTLMKNRISTLAAKRALAPLFFHYIFITPPVFAEVTSLE